MPQLLLLRHAKSSWSNPETGDHDRPLTTRGIRDAGRVGTYLRGHGLTPDLILTSTATRARQTVAGLLAGLDLQGEVKMIDALYNTSLPVLLATISRHAAGADVLLVVGHNPSIAQAAMHFAAGQGDAALTSARRKYPTAALTHFDSGTASLAEPGATLRLVSFLTPADMQPRD